MPLDYPSGNPDWIPPWDPQNEGSRGLPSLPAPEREAEGAPSEAPARKAEKPVAEWLGWSPTSWRARDSR